MPIVGNRIRNKVRELANSEEERMAMLDILSIVLESKQNPEKRIQWRKKITQIIEEYSGDDKK